MIPARLRSAPVLVLFILAVIAIVGLLSGCKAKQLQQAADTQKVVAAKVKAEAQSVANTADALDAALDAFRANPSEQTLKALNDEVEPSGLVFGGTAANVIDKASEVLKSVRDIAHDLGEDAARQEALAIEYEQIAQSKAAEEDATRETITWALSSIGLLLGGPLVARFTYRAGQTNGATQAGAIILKSSAEDPTPWAPQAISAFNMLKNAAPEAVWRGLDKTNPIS